MTLVLLILSTLVLVAICLVVVAVILVQRPSADASLGATLGGGAAESVFGGETANTLTKICVRSIVVFFILAFALFMGNIYLRSASKDSASSAPDQKMTLIREMSEASEASQKPVEEANSAEASKAPETPKAPEVPKASDAPAPQTSVPTPAN